MCESALISPKPSPRRAPGKAPREGELLLRRRSEDWGGDQRDSNENPLFAAQRTALTAATATLEASYPATAAHSEDVVALCETIGERLGVNGPDRARLLAAA